MRKIFWILLIILVLIGGGYYLWRQGFLDPYLGSYLPSPQYELQKEETSTPTQVGEEETITPGVEVTEVTVEAEEFSFTPSTLTFSKGSRVRLTLKNEGSVSHDFVIDELNVNTTLVSPGSSLTVEFDVPRDDLMVLVTYEFYCSVPGHREAGMVGTLTAN
ncbi:hypothetical protein GTO10_01495 [Candidatus Saccharibacteria bacterium]|nr:hypothetical protein [Candidatus Saccharibacteria bacterium]